MTADVLEPILVDDLEWALAETSNIPCQFTLRKPHRGTPCPNLAVARVRCCCGNCCYNGIFWACEKHLRWLREGKIGCSKCPDVGNVTWELL